MSDEFPEIVRSREEFPSTGVGRRSFLKTLAVTGAATFVATQESNAFFKLFQKSDMALDLPDDWIRAQGAIVQDYGEYLAKLRLKNISIEQILAPHFKKRGRVANCIPPKMLWRNMRETLKVVDKMVVYIDRPLVEIVSAYRSPRYNASCRGARSRSYHKKNMALDLKFDTSSYRVAKVARELRAARVFSGGVGRYRNFVHVDTRGFNSDW